MCDVVQLIFDAPQRSKVANCDEEDLKMMRRVREKRDRMNNKKWKERKREGKKEGKRNREGEKEESETKLARESR